MEEPRFLPPEPAGPEPDLSESRAEPAPPQAPPDQTQGPSRTESTGKAASREVWITALVGIVATLIGTAAGGYAT